MSYPDYPNNRLIVNGIDLTEKFKMVMADGYKLDPPEPKTYTVDIPGGNGVIDLTESLTGDTVYSNRSQEFTFYLINVEDFEKAKTQISSMLHGKAFDYKMTMDPDYTYHGRFKVSSYEHQMYSSGKLGTIVISVDANPYKKRPNIVKSINADYSGTLVTLESGRLPVKPKFHTKSNCVVIFDGMTTELTEGDWVINDVVLTQGTNELYLCTRFNKNMTWNDMEVKARTFENVGKKRIFEWYKIKIKFNKTLKWSDMSSKTFNDVKSKIISDWYTIGYENITIVPEMPEVLVEYEWQDI